MVKCKELKTFKNFFFVIILVVNNYNSNSSEDAVLQRYKQSTAPSERIYQSIETLDEALRTPWALHYEVQRRPATPNFPSNSTDSMFKKYICYI